MSEYLIQDSTLTAIGDAIRAKTGNAELIIPENMPTEIGNIQSDDTGVGSRQWWLDVCREKTTYMYLFYNCKSITSIPILDMANNNSLQYAFANCTSLVSIPLLDLQNVTTAQHAFYNCINLVHIKFVEKSIKASVVFAQSPLLSDESIQSIINGLATVDTAQTLTLHADVKAKLTESQIAQITSKNWTLA